MGEYFAGWLLGCSGDCAGDDLSLHALSNHARNLGAPATRGLASNLDPLITTRTVPIKENIHEHVPSRIHEPQQQIFDYQDNGARIIR